jgi:hypothetical protein
MPVVKTPQTYLNEPPVRKLRVGLALKPGQSPEHLAKRVGDHLGSKRWEIAQCEERTYSSTGEPWVFVGVIYDVTSPVALTVRLADTTDLYKVFGHEFIRANVVG